MSKEKPERNRRDAAEDFLAIHQEEYGRLLDVARKAQETTATAGWQDVYTENTSTHRDMIASVLARLDEASEQIKADGIDEGVVKRIKDCAKELAEEEALHQGWRNRAVACYKLSADFCQKLLAKVERMAADAEAAAPLVERGLVEAVRALTDKWPRAEWDEATGVVSVHPYKAT